MGKLASSMLRLVSLSNRLAMLFPLNILVALVSLVYVVVVVVVDGGDGDGDGDVPLVAAAANAVVFTTINGVALVDQC